MGSNAPIKPLKTRLYIGTNMSLNTVQEKGNQAQKKVAQLFDFNGDGKFQENEAATFNSVRISDYGNGKITIWQKNNGKDTATHLQGDFSNIKFAPNRDKNISPAKKTAVSQPSSNKTQATIDIENFVKQGKGELEIETYPDGTLKSKEFTSLDRKLRISQEYYENGNPKSHIVKKWDDCADYVKLSNGKYGWLPGYVETTNIQYDKNGNVINTAKVNK